MEKKELDVNDDLEQLGDTSAKLVYKAHRITVLRMILEYRQETVAQLECTWQQTLIVQSDYKIKVTNESLIYVMLKELWHPTFNRTNTQLKQF